MCELDPRTTALVLIDLQNGILSMPVQPRSGADILSDAKIVAGRFRAAGAPVILVRVGFSADGADLPPRTVDQPAQMPAGGYPPGWGDLAEGLAQPGDIHILKRQWGAFHGTELDLQLRRRGIKTIVLGGIATNLGVESTARQAWELGYDLILAEDLCATFSVDMQDMAFRFILPRLSRIRKSSEIALSAR